MRILPALAPLRQVRTAGISLIECLVYISCLGVVMGVGFMALYFATDSHKSLRSNSDDIAAAVSAGELWRKDIRAATGPIETQMLDEGPQLRIPQSNGQVTYQFAAGELRRQQRVETAWSVLLPRVTSSTMTADARDQVTAWRWELTLKPKSSRARIVPCFSFEAVPGSEQP